MRNFHVQFTEKNLTGNAGLTHLGRFAEKLGLNKMLEQHISIQRAENAKYRICDVVLMLTFGVLTGAKHISHLAILRADTVLRALFRWDDFPDATTFGRMFKLFTHKHCKELSDVEAMARRKVWSKKFFGKITLDMDSTVRGVYGRQEGAAKGYNPKKMGQKSYHPLLCFVAQNRECLHNWFRSGDTFSANGSVEFIKECFARIPKRVWKIDVRADSAFFDGNLLDYIEEKQCQHLIKVKMKGLAALLETQSWQKAKKNPNFETTEFKHKCSSWKKHRRFVAVREIVLTPSDDAMFPSPKVEYSYFCYVTNMNLTPWAAHKYYGKRATSENWIQWCKNQMASGSILTQDFWANSAIFQSCILAYNLMVWMMWLNNEDGFKEEPNTIRMYLIQVPARLLHRGRQWMLKLSQSYPFQEQWRYLEEAIGKLEFS